MSQRYTVDQLAAMRTALARVEAGCVVQFTEQIAAERDLLLVSVTALTAEVARLKSLGRRRLRRAQQAERRVKQVEANIAMWASQRVLWQRRVEELEDQLRRSE